MIYLVALLASLCAFLWCAALMFSFQLDLLRALQATNGRWVRARKFRLNYWQRVFVYSALQLLEDRGLVESRPDGLQHEIMIRAYRLKPLPNEDAAT